MAVELMMACYDQSQDAPGKSVNIERLVNLPARGATGRFKYTKEPDLDRAYADVVKTLKNEINDELNRKEGS